jgi:hypothetical protein
MSQTRRGKSLGAGGGLTATLLRWAPWLAFLLCALPLPAYFLLRHLAQTGAQEPGVYMLFALTSLAVGTPLGAVAAFFAFLYRRSWEKKQREKLAADGVTADELSLYTSELTAEQRRALGQMEAQNPLLADAYRETLAASITAARVLARTRQEAAAVEQRLARASGLRAEGRAALEQDLQKDRDRLSRVERETSEHQAEIEARLQTIEALAGRHATDAETELALRRLGNARAYAPLGLDRARAELDARDEIEHELRAQSESELRTQTEGELRELPPSGD